MFGVRRLVVGAILVLLVATPAAAAARGVTSNSSMPAEPEDIRIPLSESAGTKPQGSIEPGAGRWHTWVVKSGSEIAVPPPPGAAQTVAEMAELVALAQDRDAAAKQWVAFWDAGSPSYRWVEMAIDQTQAKPMNPLRQTRLLSYMNVAVYDAMVTAWQAKYEHKRMRPARANPRLSTLVEALDSPSYPSEHAVAAGAASEVLAYIYPDDAAMFRAKAEEAAESRVIAGAHYRSDVLAGLALGRAVAARVIGRARTDGSDTQWTGTVPVGPGYWSGQNPAEPLAGTWATWTLTRNDQFRPGPPPAYDSGHMITELNELKSFDRTFLLTAKAYVNHAPDAILRLWYDQLSRRIFEYRLDRNAPRAALAYALVGVAHLDGTIACWDAKYTYWAIRPSQLDPAIEPLFPPPPHPSYPAAHGCATTALAEAQAELFPQEAASIRQMATDGGLSRITAGIHFRSDVEAGMAIGRAVAAHAIEVAQLPD